jgi:hypothetical protein
MIREIYEIICDDWESLGGYEALREMIHWKVSFSALGGGGGGGEPPDFNF